MICLGKTKSPGPTTGPLYDVNTTATSVVILSAILLVCSGCDNSKAPVTPAPQAPPAPPAALAPPTPQAVATPTDPLADLLRLARAGDTDAALQLFVTNSPNNWFESTSLEEFRISEADFAALGRGDRTRCLQQLFLERVGEIKGFARTVMDRAKDAKKRGDDETAQRYVEAVHRFGRQLRESKTVAVFQQTGNALEKFPLSE